MRNSKTRRPTARTALSIVAVLTLLTTSGCAAWRIGQSVQLARESVPFEASPASPSASLLVVGDSTAVGTGASSPGSSLVGQISQTHPNLRIRNLARDGAKFDAIAKQLDGTERFDVILILGGGNDVIRLTGESTLRAGIDRAVSLATARSNHVILMPAGNVGNAPFFYPPVSWMMSRRARTLHDTAAEIARTHGATFVDLYRDKADDPFAQAPDRMNAADGLHPSNQGYTFWLEQLERQADLSRRLSGKDASGGTRTAVGGKAAS